MITKEQVIEHIRNRGYMSGIERDYARIRSTGEVFTPYGAVKEYIDQIKLTRPDVFSDPTKTACDTSCGDGQFLGEILIAKIESGLDFKTALNSIYGVEYEQTNVDVCRERLLCGQEHLRHVVEKNIVCADSLTYNYRFGEPETFGPDDLFEIQEKT